MDIERLTKAQIILLTLLVSFVTSIATGIVTVTLLAQAPPAVTQTINRVVERTVERVVPGEAEGETQTASVKEVVTTIVVKENDLITESIDKNAAQLVKIYSKPVPTFPEAPLTFVGMGIMVSKDGLVATSKPLIVPGIPYTIEVAGGARYETLIQETSNDSSVALLLPKSVPAGTTFSVAELGNTSSLKLGQTVISLSGSERTNVAIGIISDLEKNASGEGDQRTEILTRIVTDIDGGSAIVGSPLIDLFGSVIGFRSRVGDTKATYIPSSAIAQELSARGLPGSN